MRVLLISHSAALYGAQRSLYDLAQGLREQRVEVVATVPEKGPLMDLLQKGRFEVRLLPCRNWVNSRGTYHWARKYLIAQRQARRASCWIAEERFDVIHTNSLVTPVGAMAAKRLRLPHIWHVREGMPPPPDYFFLSFDKVRKFVGMTTKTMIGISRHTCEGMKVFCPDEKIKLIYNGPLDPKHADRSLPNRHIEEEPIRVLCVGRSSAAKGHDVAAKAVARLQKQGVSATLTIAGEATTAFLTELKQILPDGLNALGFVSDPTELYRTHDVLAMASQEEAFGRVTVEAMANGCVVLGTASGGTPEIIEHKVSGMLFPPGNDEALASLITEVRRDSDLYVALREEAHQQAYTRFTRDRYAREVVEEYSQGLRYA